MIKSDAFEPEECTSIRDVVTALVTTIVNSRQPAVGQREVLSPTVWIKNIMADYKCLLLGPPRRSVHLPVCDCEDEYYCINAKERIDVCRPYVLRGAANATASCRLSQLICAADAQCATALDYYHRLCRAMYQGRKCSHKCLNSIEILRKQEKAAALTACKCDGHEDYDCPRMQSNLARLCFRKHKKIHNKNNEVHKSMHSDAQTPKTASANAAYASPILVLTYFLWTGSVRPNGALSGLFRLVGCDITRGHLRAARDDRRPRGPSGSALMTVLMLH
ncbi:Growth arrest-specific protein 1 [Eumeta japonica]|uniref:Growth arrest-specific protein 1 n=1 Tax=Eumeta variegata TaxID=151549 RepID=A0A4C1XKC2_EUMVA|nr:Growth arrest-specific protein 1 [Eumeta japonica]